MENNMKYIKLYEKWEALKENDEAEEIDVWQQILDTVDWDKFTWLNRSDFELYDDEEYGQYTIDKIILDDSYEQTGGQILPDLIWEERHVRFRLFAVGYIEITADCEFPNDVTQLPFDIDLGNLSCNGNKNLELGVIDHFSFCDNIEVVNCPNVLNFAVEGQGLKDSVGEYILSNNGIYYIGDNLPEEAHLFDVSNNNLLIKQEALSNMTINEIKIDGNPWLEDPEVEGYIWDRMNSLSVLSTKIENGTIDPETVVSLLNDLNKIDLLTLGEKLSEEEAKYNWEIIEKFFPDLLLDSLENCKAVGNWIPPDFLARMKKYDHSEYRDSKLDSEWKDVF